jgi:hypothetical protein
MNTNARKPVPPLDLEATPSNEDPRIKSPDDILARLAPRKTQPAAEPVAEAAASAPAAVRDFARELGELRTRYDAEIAQWRDYERRIQEWRAQVVSIVQGLKRDAASRKELVEELHRCRAVLKAREDELMRIRGGAAPNFKAAV